MALVVLSYPTMKDADRLWIENQRQQYDKLHYAPLPPHFTFVFPFEGVTVDALTAHVDDIAARWRPIPFVIRCAQPMADTLSDNTYVFLMPDEGYSGMVKLHDALYTGSLAPHLRLDVPFTPHITLGMSPDADYCKRVADAINSADIEICGLIDVLDMVEYNSADGIHTVAQVRFNNRA